ncbi:hypothetical protein GF406_00325 [candidate division KSB1 bacterium]|nr:hypothetical protein [candidate division KSB1 bacterium]
MVRSFVLFLFVAQLSWAQVWSEQELRTLDSLLVVGEYPVLMQTIEAKNVDQSSIPDYEWQAFENINNSFLRTIEQLKGLTRLGQERLAEMAVSYGKQSRNYESARAGEQAAILYDRFLELSSGGQFTSALKSFFYAKHFATQHLETLKVEIQQLLNRTRELMQEKRYAAALQLVQEVEERTRYNTAFENQQTFLAGVHDEIVLYRKKIDQQAKGQQIFDIKYSQEEQFVYKWAFYGTGRIFYTGSRLEVPWRLDYRTVDRDLVLTKTVPEVKAGVGISGGVALYRAISNRFHAGFGFEYGQVSPNQVELEDYQINVDYPISHYTVQVLAQYMFGTPVGLRYYIAPGYAYGQVRRDEFNVPYAMDYSGPIALAEESELHQGLFEVGSEYIASSQSRFSLKMFLAVRYNLIDQDLYTPWQFNFGLRLGMIF